MNYIDIAFIACIVVGFLCGLVGKGVRKITRLITTVGCIAAAYFTCGTAFTMLNETYAPQFMGALNMTGTTLVEGVINMAGSYLSQLGLDPAILNGLVAGLIKVVIFWVECLVLLLVSRIVLGLFGLIFFRKTKLKPIHTLGIFGLARAAVVTVVLFFPVIVLGPVLKSLGGVGALLDATSNSSTVGAVYNGEPEVTLLDEGGEGAGEGETTNEGSNPLAAIQPIIDKIVEQMEGSKFMGYATKIVNENKDKVEIFKVEVNGVEYNAVTEIDAIPALIDGANTLLKMMPAEGEDPMETFKNMDADELKETFANLENNPTAKAAVIGVINSTLSSELGVTIPDTVNLATEGETFALVVDLMSVMPETGDPDPEALAEILQPETVANVLANSELALDLIEASGMTDSIADIIPEQQANDIKTQLDGMLNPTEGDPTISQEKYDDIMKLLGLGEPTE